MSQFLTQNPIGVILTALATAAIWEVLKWGYLYFTGRGRVASVVKQIELTEQALAQFETGQFVAALFFGFLRIVVWLVSLVSFLVLLIGLVLKPEAAAAEGSFAIWFAHIVPRSAVKALTVAGLAMLMVIANHEIKRFIQYADILVHKNHRIQSLLQLIGSIKGQEHEQLAARVSGIIESAKRLKLV